MRRILWGFHAHVLAVDGEVASQVRVALATDTQKTPLHPTNNHTEAQAFIAMATGWN